MSECKLKGQNYLESHGAWILRWETVTGRETSKSCMWTTEIVMCCGVIDIVV